MIEVRQVNRSFGAIPAVRDLTFTIPPGEIAVFLGPNGAGKSTTLRMLIGFLPPSSGEITIDGAPVRTNRAHDTALLGYMPERVPLYDEMRARDYLRFVSAMKGIAPAERDGAIGSVAERCGASTVLDRRIANLSRGFRQRVGLSQALLGDPPVLVLDEPTGGLDPEQAVEFREIIRSLRGEHTVLLSTHLLDEAARLADRILILHEGRLLADDTVDNLAGKAGGARSLSVVTRGLTPADLAPVESIPGVRSVQVDREGEQVFFTVETMDGTDPGAEIARFVVNRGGELIRLAREAPSLESVYLALTAGRGRGRDEDDSHAGDTAH
ncbi:MAG: ABC transporter ATP-binding protein [Gemmatimonadetes bacterium]|nr:ABC transporter ATP-binding protein [Gemmatimonadota bacterium]